MRAGGCHLSGMAGHAFRIQVFRTCLRWDETGLVLSIQLRDERGRVHHGHGPPDRSDRGPTAVIGDLPDGHAGRRGDRRRLFGSSGEHHHHGSPVRSVLRRHSCQGRVLRRRRVSRARLPSSVAFRSHRRGSGHGHGEDHRSGDRGDDGPGSAGGALSRHWRAGLDQPHQLAERRTALGVVRGCYGWERPGHETDFAWQPAERGDPAGAGQADPASIAGSGTTVGLNVAEADLQPAEWGDPPRTGRADPTPTAVSRGQPAERGDPPRTGRADPTPTAVSRGQPAERGDPPRTGRADPTPRAESRPQPAERGHSPRTGRADPTPNWAG